MVQARFSFGYNFICLCLVMADSYVLGKVLWIGHPKYPECPLDAGISYPELHHRRPDLSKRFQSSK